MKNDQNAPQFPKPAPMFRRRLSNVQRFRGLLGAWIAVVLSCPAPAFAQSTGDWPEPRQNPHLTAIQPLPGRMKTAPRILARFDLDRQPPPLTPAALKDGAEHRGLAIVGGALRCVDQHGKRLWESHPPGLNFGSIVAIDDLDGDGTREIALKAGRPSDPFAAATVVSLETGRLIWRYDVEPMSYVWFLHVEDFLPQRKGQELLVVMQGYPPDEDFGYLTLFAFEKPRGPMQPVWRYDFDQYTCRPTMLRSDVDGDGDREIAIITHSRMWLFEASNGKVNQFIKWDVSPGNVRSYGFNRFADLNGDGREEFLCVANFAQHHEVLLNDAGRLRLAWAHGWDENVTTGKMATTWPTPPHADVDGDGRQEVVVSMYNADRRREWAIRIYDAITGKLEYRVPGSMAFALADLNGDGASEIAAHACSDPTQNRFGPAQVWRVLDGEPQTVWEDKAANLRVPQGLVSEGRFLADIGGMTYAISMPEGIRIDKRPWRPPPEQNPPAFAAVEPAGTATPPVLLAGNLIGDERNEIVVHQSGKVRVLGLQKKGLISLLKTYPSTCAPVIADLDGDGQPELITAVASPITPPVVQARSIGKADRLLWRTELPPSAPGGLPAPRRLYLRAGRFTGRDNPDLYVWAGTPAVQSAVLDGKTGKPVWQRYDMPEIQRYWGPSMNLAAAFDADCDGHDDLVFTNPDYYCIASGPTGELLTGPLFPPTIFDQPSQGLYTFPAILNTKSSEPAVALVGGHYFQGVMSIDAAPRWHAIPSVGESRCATEGFLATESGAWCMGFGRQNGKFACVSAANGTLRWEVDVAASCSDTIACDVDADGQTEFVFATSHGELFAIGAGKNGPRRVWTQSLPAGSMSRNFEDQAGSPIAADVDGDGASEIVVALTDGRLYVLGP